MADRLTREKKMFMLPASHAPAPWLAALRQRRAAAEHVRGERRVRARVNEWASVII